MCVTYGQACNAGAVFAHAGIVSDHGAEFVCSGDLADIGSTMGSANQNITLVFISSGGVVPFDITGRPMKGWVMVEKRGFETDAALKGWLARAKVFVKTLSPK